MDFETLLYETDDRVATITFNRPERMNAFSQALCRETIEALAAADRDPDVRVIVMTGAGGKAFSTGYDIKESISGPKRSDPGWRDRLAEDLRFCYAPWRCSKPVIALIDGFCLAGALEFAQMCDIRYCSDDAQFGVLESRFAVGVVTMIMPWILGPNCRELIYTGDMFGAEAARERGLVTRVYPKATLHAEVMKVARRMSRVAIECLVWNKRSINQAFETMGLRTALSYGLEACAQLDRSNAPEYQTFDRIRREQSLQDALEWRRSQFAPYE